MSKHTYKNQQGVNFDIEILEANVPDDADYYGYIFQVIAEDDRNRTHYYKALVKKSLCETQHKSRMWLNTAALDFLKSILETYREGQTLMLFPDSKGHWYVL